MLMVAVTGAMSLSITTFSISKLSNMTLSVIPLSIMTAKSNSA
jgi:hypothetical protein